MLPILTKKIGNIFQKYVCTLADDLLANLTPPSLRFGLHYYQAFLKLANSKYKFTFMSEETVLKPLKDMDENKAACLDNLSGNFLEAGASVLAKSISQIINLSINYLIFSSDCKVTKLKLLFKRGSKTSPQNYRAISLLPVSKIIEKYL